MTELTRQYGSQSMTAALRRVLVRPPQPLDLPSWRDLGWRGEPDMARLSAEHEAFCSLLQEAGVEIVVSEGTPGNLDAIYTFDPVLVTDEGALLLRPGKSQRRDEPDGVLSALRAAGVPITGRLTGSELAEGGDTLWLDQHTLLVGHSYRTNAAGIEALERALPQVLAYMPLLPARLVALLHERGISIVEVPDRELETMAPNVLALAPRVALALDGNRETRGRMEKAGVEVLVYHGRELSKGDGGPTCLTRPLLRG
jgi:dimethylargininase